MLLLLTTMIGLGILAGLAVRGNFRNLKEISFRFTPILFTSLAIALLALFFDSLKSGRHVFQLLSLAGVLMFLLVNLASQKGLVRVGFVIVTVGWALNFIVITANKGMPLSEWAYAKSGQTEAITYGTGGFYRTVHAGPGTLFRQLGDVIPIRAYRQVVSIGDILLILGVAFVIAGGMYGAGRRAPAAVAAK